MKQYITIALIIVLGISGGRATAQALSCEYENHTFSYGERITYKVYYNWKAVWMGAGTVDFTVDQGFIDGSEMYSIKASGKTYRTYDFFFKVRDTYETYLDANTLQSRRFVRNVNEGGFLIYNNYEFDRDDATVVASRKSGKQTQVKVDTFEINPCTQDLVSAVYQARLIDFAAYKPGERIPTEIFIDDELFPLAVQYLGKERITVDGKTWNCIKFSPQLVKGNYFDTEDGMTIWVSDDGNRIPIMIESPLTVGSVKAVISKYKGLTNPVTAMVD